MKLTHAFDELFSNFRPHFKSQETFERAHALAYCSLVTYGRRTISRLICSKNEQQQDWSADYKFFSLRQWEGHDLFFEILKACDPHTHWPDNGVLVALDETIRKKVGKKIPGVTTLRDPMSLPYHVNLSPALRYLQAAAIIAPENKLEYNRAIPIYLEEAAPAKKPKKNASEEVKEQYKQEKKAKSVSRQGHQAALKIREQVDKLPGGLYRLLFLTVDGSFCNRMFLRHLPENIISIARARKDLKLFEPATVSGRNGKGRRKIYGNRLPTPEEIRQDDTYAWQTAPDIYGAGKFHDVRYKTIAPVLWQRGTGSKMCRLIVIAPLRYRKTKTSKLLYRKPAYLLIPEVEIPVELIIQYYFLRWEIEVNHRDEKSILGLCDAQVRSEKSVKRNPQFSVAVYSLLLLASICAYGAQRTDDYLPIPKWRKNRERRPSTLDILSQFRREIMIAQLKTDLEQKLKPKKKRRRNKPRSNIEAKKRGFINDDKEQQNALKLPINIISALLYADS